MSGAPFSGPVLALGFAAAEMAIVHLRFRRHALVHLVRGGADPRPSSTPRLVTSCWGWSPERVRS
ncbi:MAG: hypothetical protein R2705_22295 [Ilumatobacteraceae bacterium]